MIFLSGVHQKEWIGSNDLEGKGNDISLWGSQKGMDWVQSFERKRVRIFLKCKRLDPTIGEKRGLIFLSNDIKGRKEGGLPNDIFLFS